MVRLIGTQRESTLHAALKEWYRLPGDRLEEEVDDFVIDIVRVGCLIEIQTGNFTKIKKKIARLLENHSLRLVYPLSVKRTILRVDNTTGEIISHRLSPKKGRIFDIFSEIIYLASFLAHPGLSLEVIFVEDEVLYTNDGLGSWRRQGWSVLDRRLVNVIGNKVFLSREDYLSVLPTTINEPFTVRDLVNIWKCRPRLAQQVIYCLFKMGMLERIGKLGRSWLYQYKHV